MRYITTKEDAVSPVVGVMLMLVVTIIIAAVVSAFAGGMASSQDKVPQASISASEIIIKGVVDTDHTACPGGCYGQGLTRPDQGTGAAPDIYIVFEHKGGDSLNIDKIGISLGKLSEPGVSSLISRALSPQNETSLVASQTTNGATIGDKAQISGFGKSWPEYLEKYPDRTSIVINPGDKFVLHADYGALTSDLKSEIAWLQNGGSYPFMIRGGDVLTYDLIDLNTKKTITSGQILVPEFRVATS